MYHANASNYVGCPAYKTNYKAHNRQEVTTGKQGAQTRGLTHLAQAKLMLGDWTSVAVW